MEGSVDEARKALCAHIYDVPEISVDDFLDKLMPRRKVDVATLVDMLSKKSHFKQKSKPFTQKPPLDKSGVQGRPCWEAFRQTPASRKGRESETAVFKGLENVHEQIARCCSKIDKNLRRTNKWKSNGTKTLKGIIYTSAQPDGVRFLYDEDNDSWDSAAVTEEHKLKDGPADVVDNRQKVIWNMFQAMRTDLRRRAVLAVSIEDTTVRLWHTNREIILVSRPFDMNKNYDIFADVSARLSFATRVELGYDDTITKSPDINGEPSYRIVVDGTAYITDKILENYAAQDGFGRCTRVLRAFDEKKPEEGSIYAIKDNWMERGRETEFQIYTGIMAAIRAFPWKEKCSAPPEDIEELNKGSWKDAAPIDPRYGQNVDRTSFFIPIIAGVHVETKKDEVVVVDSTTEVIMGGFRLPDTCNYVHVLRDEIIAEEEGITSLHASRSQRIGVVGDETQRFEPRAPSGCFKNATMSRVHHRSVMYLGEPLDKIESASEAFATLSDAAYGLFILHQLDYCHRDMSAYNILRRNGRGVLADFEYTKLGSCTVCYAWRTGTANFMAIEVAMGSRLPQHEKAQEVQFRRRDKGKRAEKTLLTETPWRFREVHDLESLWWIALWLLFRHTTEEAMWSVSYSSAIHQSYYTKLFPGTLDVSQRRTYLEQAVKLDKAINTLPQAWQDVMQDNLELFRKSLYLYYGRENSDDRLPAYFWYLADRVLCEDGLELPGKLIEFTSQRRAVLLETPPVDPAQIEPDAAIAIERADAHMEDEGGDELMDEESSDEEPLALRYGKRSRSERDDESTLAGEDDDIGEEAGVDGPSASKKLKHFQAPSEN